MNLPCPTPTPFVEGGIENHDAVLGERVDVRRDFFTEDVTFENIVGELSMTSPADGSGSGCNASAS